MELDVIDPVEEIAPRDNRADMTSRPKRNLRQIVFNAVLLIACLLSVWSVVDGWIWSLNRLTTSGCEEEALFPIWKFATGQTVYSDAHAIPFSVSYFNWLFFLTYGGATKACIALLHLDYQAVPIIARLVTLGFALASIGILYRIFGLLNLPLISSRSHRLAGSIFLIINPLTGSWLLTARPDIAALACELAGLWCALRYSDTRKWSALLGAIIAGYAAWSFKQNYVHLLGGLFFFLMLRRHWRELGFLTLASIGLMGGTLLAGGANFRYALLTSPLHCGASIEAALGLFQRAIGSAPQLVPIAAGLGIAAACRQRWPASARLGLLAGVGSVALIVDFLGAAKQGADINYFMPIALFGMIWSLCLFGVAEDGPAEVRKIPNAVRWAIVAIFSVGIINGLIPHARKVSSELARLMTAQQSEPPSVVGREVAQLKRHLNELPSPAFVTDRACNLPWIQTKAPHFVYSFTYALDRKAGSRFERGGVGGLIEEGYFETVVVLERNCACESSAFEKTKCSHVTMTHLPLVKDGPVPSIDGGRMLHYELAFRDGAFTYYRKRAQGRE